MDRGVAMMVTEVQLVGGGQRSSEAEEEDGGGGSGGGGGWRRWKRRPQHLQIGRY
jgi:hypothetical protein